MGGRGVGGGAPSGPAEPPPARAYRAAAGGPGDGGDGHDDVAGEPGPPRDSGLGRRWRRDGVGLYDDLLDGVKFLDKSIYTYYDFGPNWYTQKQATAHCNLLEQAEMTDALYSRSQS